MAQNPSITSPTAEPDAQDGDDVITLGGLYRHGSRPDWGLATRVDYDGGRYAYQFEDGRLRKLAASHDHFMEEVHRPFDEGERLRRQLEAMAGKTLAHRSIRDAGSALISLEQQIRLFAEDFEGGFEGPAWIKQHRGTGKKGTKRHREPAIARAKELLDEEAIAGLIAVERHDTVMERVSQLLSSTTMLTARQLAPLARLDEEATLRAAESMHRLLYGDANVAEPMRDWIGAVGRAGLGVTWSLATAVPALVHPTEHYRVRESVFSLQVRWMAPRVVMQKTPSGPSYVHLRDVALTVRDELIKRGLAPRDLLDVYDFVWWTLRPASQKRIAAMPRPQPYVKKG